MTSESLISISEASQILGVNEATLRQWTDEGKIKAFVTPGGHRRYSRAELKKLMSTQSKTLGVKDLVSQLEDTSQLHREISQEAIERNLRYHNFTEEAQRRLAQLGRSLLSLIIKYITEPARRDETIEAARAVGREHGEMLAELGLPLTDSVEAFILHRDPIINAATHLMRKREGLTGRLVEAIPMSTRVMDEALVALVAAHQQKYKKLDNEIDGGTL